MSSTYNPNTMAQKIVIVESPGKIKTIQKYLDKSYKVVSCYGHVRDLPKKHIGVDVDRDFVPTYVVTPSQVERIKALQALTDKASFIYLATDDDREGEAISWHVREVLKLPTGKYKRIVFRSITKQAIQQALQAPRDLDRHLIDAQQARRILDRIVGYLLTPVLWKRVTNNLSGGRVQSVALRLIAEKEQEVQAFVSEAKFKVTASFSLPHDNLLKAQLPKDFTTYQEAQEFIQACPPALFFIEEVKQHRIHRAPPPPLMTSSLQQIAAQELGFSVNKTMTLAQKLYEQGKITYMRTDSLHLAPEALVAAKKVICATYGAGYHKKRHYKNKSDQAQEAHEAIRPTRFDVVTLAGDSGIQRLYTLIRRRALASQMQDAAIDKTTATIKISTRPEKLVAKGEVIHFKGFLASYQTEGTSIKSHALPPLQVEQRLERQWIQAHETYTKAPARYNEGTLVKKLEQLGIGRPSTYRSIIATIQQRDYVEMTSREGQAKPCRIIRLDGDDIEEKVIENIFERERNKFFPTSLGMIVNKFLLKYFKNIVNYRFTAHTEIELDRIAQNKLLWKEMLATFYQPFNQQVKAALLKRTNEEAEPNGEFSRHLGEDPITKEPVIARLSRKYGPLVQIGKVSDEKKPRFASLRPEQLLDYITLEEALALFVFPRQLGEFEAEPIHVKNGPYGPYIKHRDKFVSIGKRYDAYTITKEEAIELIELKRVANTPLKTFAEEPTIAIFRGPYGPYIKTGKKNIAIPKGRDPLILTLADCQEIVAKAPTRKKRSFKKKKKTTTKKNSQAKRKSP